MNKRFLYRAKSVDTGDLVFGSLVYSSKENLYYIVEQNDEELSWVVYRDTICQCTGYEDDEGYLIFEGDEVVSKYSGYDINGKIIYLNGCFYIKDTKLNICLELILAIHRIKLINPTYIE